MSQDFRTNELRARSKMICNVNFISRRKTVREFLGETRKVELVVLHPVQMLSLDARAYFCIWGN